MKTEFVLIDFENTQPKDVASLNGGRYKIKVFLGAQQAKIPLEMARALQAFGPHAEYIQISGNGNNAVDFHGSTDHVTKQAPSISLSGPLLPSTPCARLRQITKSRCHLLIDVILGKRRAVLYDEMRTLRRLGHRHEQCRATGSPWA